MPYSDAEAEDIAHKAARYAVEQERRQAPSMSEINSLVERVAKQAAEAAVAQAVPAAIAQTLTSFGLDPNNRGDVLRDLMFLRDMRTLSADSKKHFLLAIIGILATAVCSAVYFYARTGGKLP